ncbi:hypothetical protein V6C27_14560 [Peptococcaceae bacterium 1198_IL3148]
MYLQKKYVLLVSIIIGIFIFTIGCGNSATDVDKASVQTENKKVTDEAKSTKDVNNSQLTPEVRVFQSMLKHLDIEYDNNKLNDIASKGGIETTEFKIGLTSTGTINNKKFYKFEVLPLGNGAASSYIVSAETGKVYNSFDGQIIQEFNLNNLKYDNVVGRKLYIITENYPEGNNSYYVDGKTMKTYFDIIEARKQIISEIAQSDPLLNLVGKDMSFVQSKTGQSVQTEVKEIHYDDGFVENMEFRFISYNKAKIYFDSDGTYSYMELPVGASILTTKCGMTFNEIRDILGSPNEEYHDTEYGEYVMQYNINGKQIDYFSETPNGVSQYIIIYD